VVAELDMPAQDLGFGQTLAKIGKLEDCHACTPDLIYSASVARIASAMRATPGM
jgi:hypothetical protein